MRLELEAPAKVEFHLAENLLASSIAARPHYQPPGMLRWAQGLAGQQRLPPWKVVGAAVAAAVAAAAAEVVLMLPQSHVLRKHLYLGNCSASRPAG